MQNARWITRRPAAPTRLAAFLVAVGLLAGLVTRAAAERTEPLPKDLEGVGISQNLDAQIPLDLAFVDSDGKPVTLADYFDGSRPVILTMNYSNCPKLCSLQLNGLVKTLGEIGWDLGDEFQVLTVSIDPDEKTSRAAETKAKYLLLYGREGCDNGWHFVTGSEENIRTLAETVGFGYRRVEETGEFAHEAVLMICTPDGRVSQYLAQIRNDPETLRLVLVEAADGKIGTIKDQFFLSCFAYDPSSGRYGPAAVRMMRVGGAVTLVLMAGMVALFWRRGVRKRRRQESHTPEETP